MGVCNYNTIGLSRIPVNKGTNSRLGWANKYSDLYEIVHPSPALISLCLLTHLRVMRKGLFTSFSYFYAGSSLIWYARQH